MQHTVDYVAFSNGIAPTEALSEQDAAARRGDRKASEAAQAPARDQDRSWHQRLIGDSAQAGIVESASALTKVLTHVEGR